MRPTPKLVAAAVLGMLAAFFALAWDAARLWVVGWDVLLILAWWIDSRWVPRELRATRHVRPRVQLDEEATVEIALEAARSVRATLVDEAPAALIEDAQVDRSVSVRLIAGGVAQVRYGVRARRRGDAVFGALNAIVEGPLGLACRRLVIEPEGTKTVQVLPKIGGLERGELDPRLLMAELGIKPVRRPFEGTELESLREAQPDDELRRIDWRATARRGKPIARNYEVERNHDVMICVDTGRLMGAAHEDGADTKLDLAIAASLRLAAVALESGDRVGVMAFDTRVTAWVPPQPGRPQLARLLDATYALEASDADASYVRALVELRRRQKKRALVVFLTDFVDADLGSGMLESLAVLARRHVVLFIALRDPALRALADHPVQGLSDVYRAAAAMGLDEARATVVEAASARGVRALDLPPEAVTAAAVRNYLALRAADRI